jgi:hypothetical protein
MPTTYSADDLARIVDNRDSLLERHVFLVGAKDPSCWSYDSLKHTRTIVQPRCQTVQVFGTQEVALNKESQAGEEVGAVLTPPR